MATNLNAHIQNFQNWLKTDPGDAAVWQNERNERLAWYQTHLSQADVGKLTREDFDSCSAIEAQFERPPQKGSHKTAHEGMIP